ncbi:hypothetical protein [Saccharothrix obliqua]|uniref:hypothetical protein n=1 Tax=Saccharothrix obliqua TaxID=2861747 RepID=UPI001C603B7F|nr:hypothetical protein [Saccharothrix obliqua]MBW4717983.1 hypothetical protein [Saccharothrix obliqua]
MSDHDFLAPLRDVEPGPSRVDVARAVRNGRRRRRARPVLAALAVCVALGTAIGVLPEHAPEPAAVVLDPLRQVARVGTAGGFTPLSYTTGVDRQEIALTRADSPGAPAGVVVLHAGGRRPAGEPVPDVAGRTAVWTGTTLVWEWSPGAWGEVRLDGGFADLRNRAHRVAQAVVADGGTPVAVPFRITTPLRLVSVRSPVRPGPELAAVELAGDGGTVVVSLRSDGLPDRDVTANARVADRPAVTSDGGVDVLDPGGRYAVRVAPGRGAAPGGTPALTALAAAVHPVPDPADRRTWVADPLTG